MIQLDDVSPNASLEPMDRTDGVTLILSIVLLTPLPTMPTIYAMLVARFSRPGEITLPKDV